MNDGERLAAYLVGELDPAQRRELEARLERDPSLRERLERIRNSDAALAALPEVTPRPEFSDRLRAELRGELSAARLAEDTDELSAQRRRREERGAPRWLAPLGAAAAALALFAVVGVGLSNMGSSDEESADTTAMSGVEGGADAERAEEAAAPGPVIIAQGRSYDTESVEGIADHPVFQQVLGQGSEAARATSENYSSQLGVGERSAEDAPGDDGEAGSVEGDAAPAAEPRSLAALVEGQASAEELATVQRCLPPLFEEAGTLVPVYAELATFEGEPAVVYGLVAEDRDTGTFSRTEIWVLAQDSCEVRYFTQS